jgi:hypothetical protein
MGVRERESREEMAYHICQPGRKKNPQQLLLGPLHPNRWEGAYCTNPWRCSARAAPPLCTGQSPPPRCTSPPVDISCQVLDVEQRRYHQGDVLFACGSGVVTFLADSVYISSSRAMREYSVPMREMEVVQRQGYPCQTTATSRCCLGTRGGRWHCRTAGPGSRRAGH